MADRLARELERHYQRSAYQTDDDLVFCHPETGHVLDPSKVRKRFNRALKLAGVPEITFHELRHTFGTQMAAVGTPLRAIQEWMGHADAKTTEVYRHYAPDPTHGAALVERAFGSGPPEAAPGLKSVAAQSGGLANPVAEPPNSASDRLDTVQAVADHASSQSDQELPARRPDRPGSSECF